jgi:hypothetical protein
VVALSPALAAAQSRDSMAVIEGHVRDAVDSGAVALAEVRVGERFVRSDGLGKYRLTVPPGEHEIVYRILGYAPTQLQLPFAPGETVRWDIYLDRVPQLLTSMEVRGKSVRVPAGYETVYKRAARGLGSFITKERIDSLAANNIMAVLREANVPFIRAERNVSDQIMLVTQRCRSVQLLFNGTPITYASAITDIMEKTPPGWVQAIEVYDSRATMPLEFLPNCGVVAIWTRPR